MYLYFKRFLRYINSGHPEAENLKSHRELMMPMCLGAASTILYVESPSIERPDSESEK